MSSLLGPVPEGYLVLGEHNPDAGYQAARRLWELALPPTAIFATADSLAIGALAALLDMGIAVPGDASVIGFDDLAFSRFVRPALTTIHEPVKEIGRAAVEMVVEMTEGRADGDASVPRRLLAPRLVERASCGPVPRGVSLGSVSARQVDTVLDQTAPGRRN
jgi:DNA-binding LacI/PurR family transcriptional regulator